MKHRPLTLALSLLVFVGFAFSASAVSEENISRQLDVTPGGKLIVDVDFGRINVTAGADDKVTLDAHRRIDFGDEAKEKEYLAEAPVTFTKEGNVVTVRVHRAKRERSWNFGHSEMDGSYTIRLPKKFEMDLRTAGGDIGVADISGELKTHTSGGKLSFKNLEGKIEATTSGGSIRLEDCRGPIAVETSGGDIHMINGTGSLNAETSGGRIEVRNFSGDTEVNTNGGNLVLERIAGKITGHTSGGSITASVPGNVIGDVRLETSAGNIDVALPSSAPLDISAKTSVGQVISDLPLEVSDVGRDHLHGKMNGGGKSVTLRTSAGNITLEAASQIAGR